MPQVLAKATCFICAKRIPHRVTYLYVPTKNAWICKECWGKADA